MKEYRHLLELFLAHLSAHTATLREKKPSELYLPEDYILSLGGKRLRPLLALVACDLFDHRPESALGAALAVELFHNFSLIHDDILDSAPLRRGQPTIHKKWNTNIAILSGDVMLVKAVQALERYDPAAFRELTSLFNTTAIQVCEGQQMDMNFESLSDVTVDDYLEMITKKTAVLLGCSLQMGAITAGAEHQNQQYLYEFGKNLGIAFQLLDDLLDAFAGDGDKFGKQTGGDIIANKKTFLMLKALELASPGQKKKIGELVDLQDETQKVTEMLRLYDELDIQTLCISAADSHTQKAIKALDHVVANPAKKAVLRQFALELLDRKN